MAIERPVKLYDFGKVQVAPAYEIDRQFDNHKRAIDAIIKQLNTVLRADGKLNNDLLTPESFPPKILDKLHDDAFNDAALARGATAQMLAQIVSRQNAIEKTQKELKALIAKNLSDNAATRVMGEEVQARSRTLSARIEPMMLAVQTQAEEDFNEANEILRQAAVAEDWANVSIAWAEYMPDTIPPNILATNAITGDHWSSRWWANRSANAFGQLAWLYYGGSVDPPEGSSSTGGAIPPGALWYDTGNNTMMVWNGTQWVPLEGKPIYADTLSLYYIASDGQTAFPLDTPDMHGKSVSLMADGSQGVIVFLNGVRLTPSEDFVVDPPSSTITLAIGASAGSVLAVDVLIPSSQLQPGRVEALLVLDPNIDPVTGQPGQQDGVRTDFGLYVAQDSSLAGVGAPEELLVSYDGALQSPGVAYTLPNPNTIRFDVAPRTDTKIFIIWFRSPSDPTAT
jgi:hypothetical protein